MNRAIKAAIVLAAASLLLVPGGAPADSAGYDLYIFNYDNVLGTSLQLKIFSPSAAQSDRSAAAALMEIDRENKILSSWDPTSEFSRWFRTMNQPVTVSPELFEVFGLFDRWRERTNGGLDASAEAVTRLWQKAAAEKRVPNESELNTAVASVRKAHWKLDSANHTATHTSGTPLGLNSFVKSYIVGHAADAALRVTGVRGVVVNIGGDLVVRGNWTEPVSIADPMSDAENADPIAVLKIRDRAVATSGDYRRGVEIGGRHYSHIVDPRTGMPVDEIISSTVIARNPADAGALATVFSVLSPEESQQLAATVPGAEYLLVKKNGEMVASGGWASLLAPRKEFAAANRAVANSPVSQPVRYEPVAEQSARPAPASQSSGALWDRDYELTISLEVNHIEGNRIMRPFVVVWIEDEQKTPVRTVALWYGKFKYLTELHTWYAVESQRSDKEVDFIMNSISSATRPPGKYKLRWDGKDNTGKYVKAGKYTVAIEASREHGTYQLIRQEMEFKGVPKQIDLPGNMEIASAALDYHKITH